MPAEAPLPVTCVATTDISDMLNPIPGRRQPMAGFDAEFVDIADYIIRITDRIWHEKKVDLCLRYYGEDAVIHTLTGDITGAETVVANTWKTLDGFPDRTLDGDNVIWSGDDQRGYLSSHLITSHMTNLGPSEFGPATGRRARVRTIADCLCKENRVIEEWLVRDNLALVQQLGLDGWAIANGQAQADIDSGRSLLDLHAPEIDRVMSAASLASLALPDVPEQAAADFAAAVLGRCWLDGSEKAIAGVYDYRAEIHGPSGRHPYGTRDLTNFFGEFRAMFPDLAVTVDHVGDIPYLGDARDIAVRWSVAGIHTGAGRYGEPTGAKILILGVSHWRVINGRIREEWMVFDELAVMRQVETARLQAVA